jgi:hypothetical protein
MENTLTLEKTPSWIDQKETLSDEIDGSVFGQKLSLTAKLFGCRHRNISRPFNQGATAYRVSTAARAGNLIPSLCKPTAVIIFRRSSSPKKRSDRARINSLTILYD